MSPELLSAMDTSIMSEDQAQISAIEQQLMQVEKNINSSHQQLHLASSPSPSGAHHHHVASPSPGVADSPRPASFSSPSPSHQQQNASSSSSTSAGGGLGASGLQQAMSSPTGGLAQAMSPPSSTGRVTAGQAGEASSQMQHYLHLDSMKVTTDFFVCSPILCLINNCFLHNLLFNFDNYNRYKKKRFTDFLEKVKYYLKL